jgi:hypothetical protein
MFIIFFNDLTNSGLDLLGTYSDVVNLIFLERLTTNGIPSTNMTSTARVTSLFSSRISFGI